MLKAAYQKRQQRNGAAVETPRSRTAKAKTEVDELFAAARETAAVEHRGDSSTDEDEPVGEDPTDDAFVPPPLLPPPQLEPEDDLDPEVIDTAAAATGVESSEPSEADEGPSDADAFVLSPCDTLECQRPRPHHRERPEERLEDSDEGGEEDEEEQEQEQEQEDEDEDEDEDEEDAPPHAPPAPPLPVRPVKILNSEETIAAVRQAFGEARLHVNDMRRDVSLLNALHPVYAGRRMRCCLSISMAAGKGGSADPVRLGAGGAHRMACAQR